MSGSLAVLGRLLVISGIILIAFGVIFSVFGKATFLGRLWGDIYIQKKNFSLYFPLTTCILMSLFLTLLLWFFSRR